MLNLTRGLNETITKTLEQFAKSQTLSRKNAVRRSSASPAKAIRKRTSATGYSTSPARRTASAPAKPRTGSKKSTGPCSTPGRRRLSANRPASPAVTSSRPTSTTPCSLRRRAKHLPPAGFRSTHGVGHLAVPLPRHHHRPVGGRVAVLRRRTSLLDGGSANPHRDRAAVRMVELKLTGQADHG
jgi:hypothetical protein